MTFDAVLFDVDGTLIDSNGAHAETWAQALREEGVQASGTDVRPLIGMGGDKLLPAIAHVAEDSALGQRVARRKKALFEVALGSLQPTRGARALVEFLHGQNVKLVIATSADEQELQALLTRVRVDDLFPRRTSRDDAAESKPSPDIVEAALNKSRVPASRAVMIGDTPYDVEAAARAGLKCIALRCGGYWSDSDLVGALGILDDPAALLEYWHRA